MPCGSCGTPSCGSSFTLAAARFTSASSFCILSSRHATCLRASLGGYNPRGEAAVRASAKQKMSRALSKMRVTRALRGSNHVGQANDAVVSEVEEERRHEEGSIAGRFQHRLASSANESFRALVAK